MAPSSHRVLAAGILAFLLAVPVSGFGQRGGKATNGQTQGQGGRGGSGTGSTQTAAPVKTQTPQQGQQTPRPTPNAEQFLQGWDWWNDDAIKKELKLTDMQVRQISQIFDRRLREVTPIYEDYRKQRAELERMTQERTVDEATYAVQVGRTQYLLSELNKTRTVMLYAIYRRLDQKQNETLRTIRDRRFGRGGGAPTPRTW